VGVASAFLLAVAAALMLGAATAFVPLALLLAVVLSLLLAAFFVNQRFVLLMVLPSAFAAWRAPLIPQGVSISDVVLALALGLLAMRGTTLSNRTGQVFRGIIMYQALLLIPVVVHPTSAAVVDWGHRFFLMAGALVVGNEIVRVSSRRTALKAFVLVCAGIGFVASIQAIASGLAPVYPLGLSKNLAGEVLACGVLVSITVGRDALASRPLQLCTAGLALAGLVATQSRGAWLGLAVAVGIWSLYARPNMRILFAAAVVGLSAAAYVLSSLAAESDLENSQQTSSLESRLHFEEVALDYFQQSPVIGQGLRFYLDPAFDFPVPLLGEGDARPAPHNVVVEALSEAGIVGLAALALLIASTVAALVRNRTPYSMLACAALLGNLAHGMVDIYWLAGSLTLPWVLIGLAGSTPGRPRSGSECMSLAQPPGEVRDRSALSPRGRERASA
jgi:polysaccharide biosynthesis protein PslJ